MTTRVIAGGRIGLLFYLPIVFGNVPIVQLTGFSEENIDSLNRATQFLAKKASKLALAAIPLAAIAVSMPARAGVILNTGSNCVVYGTSGSCTTVQAGATGANPGMNWIQLSGTGYSYSGGDVDLFVPSGGSGSFANGVYFSGGTIPISWDFSVNALVDPYVSWEVFADIYNTSGDWLGGFYQSGGIMTGGGVVSGSGSFSISGGYIGGYDFGVDFYTESNTSYSVNVPAAGTLDLNAGVAGTPEPSTMLLGPLGGGLLLLLKRRKRVN